MPLLTHAHTVLKTTIDFLFPGSCAACNMPCDGAASLCAACRTKLDQLTTSPLCELCAFPLSYACAPCPRCRGKGIRPFDRLSALGVYEAPLSDLIVAIKYRGAWEWVSTLTDLLVKSRKLRDVIAQDALLVPIPLHLLRRLTRSYNQARLIADCLGRKLGLDRADALMRVRHTSPQTLLHSRAKRAENLKNAFAVEVARTVRNRHIVLIDDVTTTGATLHAAATALRTARPASISACVLAVADPKHRSFERI